MGRRRRRRRKPKKKTPAQIAAEKKKKQQKADKAYKDKQQSKTKLEQKHEVVTDKVKAEDAKHGYVRPEKEKPYEDMSNKWANKYGQPEPYPKQQQQSAKGGKGQNQTPGSKGGKGQSQGVDNTQPPPQPQQPTYAQRRYSNPYSSSSPQYSTQSMPPTPQYQSSYDPSTGTMKYSPMAKLNSDKFSGSKNSVKSSFKMKGFKAFDAKK